MKMIFYTFSKDFKNRRITGRCISSKGRMDISEQPGYSFINISKKDVSWAKSVTPKNLSHANTPGWRMREDLKKEYSFFKKVKELSFLMMLKRLNFILMRH